MKFAMKFKRLLLFFLFFNYTTGARETAQAALPPKKSWLTLNGGEPLVVARGGFSGLFPESSEYAYTFALQTSLPDVIMYCDLQLTKDGEGFCQSPLDLKNCTNIDMVFPKGQKRYNVNGKVIDGWFGLDYEAMDLLSNVTLSQNILSRPPIFDGVNMLTPLDVVDIVQGKKIWINVEYNTFFKQQKLRPEAYLETGMGKSSPNYISSPEIAFLKYMSTKVSKTTKLVFKFLEPNAIEPTTKQDYASLLKDLTTIKSFASGILVPKEYIWPVNKGRYLQPATTLVSDAHKQGLEVFASGFANDNLLSYNYSYDPTSEYLQFIHNSQFSIDGVLTDFPSTASEAISCLMQKKNSSRVLKTLIISHEGASGDYPGSSDLAYQKAIDDGVDIIDCSVQMSKDGVTFCLDSADLTATTTAATLFMERSSTVPEIQAENGIFSFDFEWSEIQSVKPQILSPTDKDLARNPANKNKGKFVTLAEFLELAKSTAVPGVLINIENAAYLASKKGLDIIGAVTSALSNATLDKQSKKKVLIQSDDSSVLLKFKDVPSYQRVLNIKKHVGGVTDETAQEVKKYADAISVHKDTIVQNYADPFYLTSNLTNMIPIMHAANVSVYVGVLKNEFSSILFDYFSDPYVELATYIAAGVDGVITEFPATSNAYMRSPCANPDAKLDYAILAIKTGDLYSLVMQNPEMAPASAPMPPVMSTEDVVDPPLPPITDISAVSDSTPVSTPAPGPGPKASSSARSATRAGLYLVALFSYLLNLV